MPLDRACHQAQLSKMLSHTKTIGHAHRPCSRPSQWLAVFKSSRLDGNWRCHTGGYLECLIYPCSSELKKWHIHLCVFPCRSDQAPTWHRKDQRAGCKPSDETHEWPTLHNLAVNPVTWAWSQRQMPFMRHRARHPQIPL
jgi:hypothetical protein